jgi:hypothetical protein
MKDKTYAEIIELYTLIIEWANSNSAVIYLAEKLKDFVDQDKASEINRCLEQLKKYCSHLTEKTQISWKIQRDVMELTYLQSMLEKYAWAKHCENIEPPRFEWIVKPTQKDIVDAFYINAYWWIKIKLMEFKMKFQSIWLNVLFSQIDNAYKNDKSHALLQLLTKAKNIPQLNELIPEEDWNKIEIMVQELIYIENYNKK